MKRQLEEAALQPGQGWDGHLGSGGGSTRLLARRDSPVSPAAGSPPSWSPAGSRPSGWPPGRCPAG